MTESNNFNQQYHNVLYNLKMLNPNIPIEDIKRDTEDLLYEFFVESIYNIKIPKKISNLEIRKERLRFKLFSIRQSLRGQRIFKERLDKDETFYKFKALQQFFKKLRIPSIVDIESNNFNIFSSYVDYIDKSSKEGNGFKDRNSYKQNIFEKLNLTNRKSMEKYIKYDNISIETLLEKPHTDLFFNYLSVITQLDKASFDDSKELFKIPSELREEIKNLELKPIKKLEPKKYDLSEFIGFIEEKE